MKKFLIILGVVVLLILIVIGFSGKLQKKAIPAEKVLTLSGVALNIPEAWTIKGGSTASSSTVILPDSTSVVITINPCLPNEPISCFGSGALGKNAAPAKEITNGKILYPVSTDTMARFGLELDKDNNKYYYDASANFGDNHKITDTEYKAMDSIMATAKIETIVSVEYSNTKYGFTVSLLDDWKGYSVVTSTWQGFPNGNNKTGTVQGPMISLRNPLWTSKTPYQDIPVMVFTKAQWADLQKDIFHIGAAPINPSELASNSTYVFGLPARYNYAYIAGWQEVDKILKNNAVRATNPTNK